MTDRTAPCLYLHAPKGDEVPWCGIYLSYPERCKVCDQYEVPWAAPTPEEVEAWRRTGADVDRQLRDFGAQLRAKQQPLGPEMNKVLHDNLWDLYERT